MKYIGAKTKIAKYIVPIIQSYIDNNNIELYIEPFVGGFNLPKAITAVFFSIIYSP